jgi:hypothetical protein
VGREGDPMVVTLLHGSLESAVAIFGIAGVVIRSRTPEVDQSHRALSSAVNGPPQRELCPRVAYWFSEVIVTPTLRSKPVLTVTATMRLSFRIELWIRVR